MKIRTLAFIVLALGTILFTPATVQAVGSATLSLSPAVGSFEIGSTFNVSIYESSTTAMNAVQAALAYDPASLQFVSISATGSPFTICSVTPSGGSGSINLACAAPGDASTLIGDQLVAQITFKVLAGSGSTAVSFTAGSKVASYADKKYVDSLSLIGGSYALTTPVGGGTGSGGTGSGGGSTPTGTGTNTNPVTTPATTNQTQASNQVDHSATSAVQTNQASDDTVAAVASVVASGETLAAVNNGAAVTTVETAATHWYVLGGLLLAIVAAAVIWRKTVIAKTTPVIKKLKSLVGTK